MTQSDHPTPTPQDLDIPASDWQQAPESVQAAFIALLKRVEALEARLNRESSNSSRPPSMDSSAKRRNCRKKGC